MSAVAASPPDPFDPRLARHASGRLREFNAAGVLAAADVHVARRLAALGDEHDETVLLAVALAVRAPRLGHVLVDLTRIRGTVAVDAEDPVDLEALAWPDPEDWVARVRRSPLVAIEDQAEAEPGTAAEAEPVPRPLRLLGTWLYLDRYWAEETAVAAALRARLLAEPGDVDAAALQDGLRRLFGEEVAGRQAQAAAAAVARCFAVVAGGPGTGKTTTVARIVALLCEQSGVARSAAGRPDRRDLMGTARRDLIALAAPTGKAAARLQEAVHAEAAQLDVSDDVRHQLLDLRASTLHRLLGWRSDSDSRFRHGADRHLPHDVVIVDETSMVSLSLMARLLEALRPDARLVLVGDPGQLASIEAGAVLGDIVATAGADPDRGTTAPTDNHGIVVLDRGHRFGGGIARLAAAIRRGDVEATLSLLREGSDDVTWVATNGDGGEGAALVRSHALAAAEETIAAARAGAEADSRQALASFRILCAHRRGPAGVAAWTARVEDWLADDLPGFSAQDRWYVGRPLLVTENDYELGLANGDTGVVVRTAGDRVMASFGDGDEGGRGILCSPSRLGAVDTVYAMTIHKSQGSQFDAAAVLLPEPGSRLLTRELLYTAATRARRRLILAGGEEAIAAAVARPVARSSGLGWRLWGAGRQVESRRWKNDR